jgi:hypothetical protein
MPSRSYPTVQIITTRSFSCAGRFAEKMKVRMVFALTCRAELCSLDSETFFLSRSEKLEAPDGFMFELCPLDLTESDVEFYALNQFTFDARTFRWILS